jgi:hypothetical protein
LKAADKRDAEATQVAEILERDPVEDALVGREIRQNDPRGEVTGFEGGRARPPPGILEFLGRRILDEHPRGAIRPAPDDCTPIGDVARRDALWHRRPIHVRLNDRRKERRRDAPRETATDERPS